MRGRRRTEVRRSTLKRAPHLVKVLNQYRAPRGGPARTCEAAVARPGERIQLVAREPGDLCRRPAIHWLPPDIAHAVRSQNIVQRLPVGTPGERRIVAGGRLENLESPVPSMPNSAM
jgi:hypothetical protein